MRRGLTAACLLLLLGTPARAQTPGMDAGSAMGEDAAMSAAASERPMRSESKNGSRLALPGPVDATQYRVGPGDELRLSFSGTLTRETVLVVGPEGSLALPGAGSLPVAGLTLAETRTRVLARLQRDLRGVIVDLRLERPRTFRVFLTGRVKQAGETEATAVTSLAELLVADRLESDASTRRIELRRRDGSVRIADLGAFLAAGDASGLPELADGDVIHVPVAREFVHVFGAAATPGRIERAPTDSLATILRLVGGALPSAAPGPMLWLHWQPGAARPDTVWVDAADASRLARAVADGDRLYIYFQSRYRQQHEALVLGEVRRPGQFPITEGRTRLSDIVREAGGLLPTADPSAIHVHRSRSGSLDRDIELERLLRLSRDELTASEYEAMRTRLAAQREDYRVDWRLIEQGNADLDLLLLQGDILRVERLVNAIRVDGEVRRPSIVTYEPKSRLADYIRKVGGYTNRAWQGKVRVTRAVNGQTLYARDVPALDPGDFVWVPEKPDDTAWMRTQQLLTALAQVATVVIAIRSVR